MVDNLLVNKNKLLINSEAFFVQQIDNNNLTDCLAVENSIVKKYSRRSKSDMLDLLNNYSCFGIFKNETLIGFIVLSIIEQEAEIIDIAIDSKYQNKKIGFNFLSFIFNLLKNKQVTAIILEVACDNTNAIKTYQKFNYQHIGTRKNYYKAKDGTKTDALVYKILA